MFLFFEVARTEAVEVLVLLLEKLSQKVHIDANDFAHMKKLRILKIYQEEKVSEQKLELKGHNVIFSGNLYYLSNELSLFYWHGCPFKYLPSDFYPENIVAIDLSYSNIKHFWTTPKVFPCTHMFSYLISNDPRIYLFFLLLLFIIIFLSMLVL
jgi:hypothetical protein